MNRSCSAEDSDVPRVRRCRDTWFQATGWAGWCSNGQRCTLGRVRRQQVPRSGTDHREPVYEAAGEGADAPRRGEKGVVREVADAGPNPPLRLEPCWPLLYSLPSPRTRSIPTSDSDGSSSSASGTCLRSISCHPEPLASRPTCTGPTAQPPQCPPTAASGLPILSIAHLHLREPTSERPRNC